MGRTAPLILNYFEAPCYTDGVFDQLLVGRQFLMGESMKRLFGAFAAIMLALLPASAFADRVTLAKSDRLLVTAEIDGDNAIIVIESVADTTNNLAGAFPAVDFSGIRVDVNQNGRVDNRVDVAYGIVGGSSGKICPQFLLTETSSTGCGGFPSAATVKAEFKATNANPTAHPVWTYTIPKSEISKNGSYAHLTFKIYEAGRGYTQLPKPTRTTQSFSKVTTLNFQRVLTYLQTRKDIVLRPKIITNPRLPDISGVTGDLVRTDDHIVAVRNSATRIQFILEAISDTTNDLNGTWPNVDFVSIGSDVDQNGTVTRNVDVAYGISGGSADKICTQHLLTESSSTGCNGFSSQATLSARFVSTAKQPTPHPVWVFTIPKSELGPDGKSAHLYFRFHNAGKGYTRFPTPRDTKKFSSAIALDLDTLKATFLPEETVEEELPPEVADADTGVEEVANDTEPPLIALTSPQVEPGARVTHTEKDIDIAGLAEDDSGIYEILVNGEEAAVAASGAFSKNVRLVYGENPITIKATDSKDNTNEFLITVVRETATEEEVSSGDDATRGVGSIDDETAAEIREGDNFALLIAIEDYDDPAIVDLDNPVSDARKLRDVLVAEYDFETENVTVLENPNEDDVYSALQNLAAQVTENDSVIIFYAGHGQWDEQISQGYWLPSDAAATRTSNWISNGDIRDEVKRLQSKHTLVISDACFSGGIFKTRGGIADASRAVKELYDKSSRKAMTSGTLTEVPDRSVFLEYLVKQLEDNENPFISADQLFTSFRPAVINNSPNTPQYGVIFEAGDEGGEFIFVKK